MEQYKVPQFIDGQSKIIGPITIRQLVIMCVMGFVEAMLYFLIPNRALFIVVSILFLGVGLSLLFIPFNGRPLYATFVSMIGFLAKPRVYQWKQATKQGKKMVYIKQKPQVILVLKPDNIRQFSTFLDKKQN